MSGKNQAVLSLNMARNLKFRIHKVEGFTIRVAKTKALISFAVTAKLICVFVFAYVKTGFLMTRLICECVVIYSFTKKGTQLVHAHR